MIVQTLVYPQPAHVLTSSRAAVAEHDPESIVAPQRSELAHRLRSSGWVERSGWLSRTPDGHVWLVRFEFPRDVNGTT